MHKTAPAPSAPSAPPAALEKRSARERLLAAADTLFYEGGIHTVGIDRVIEEAGVAKASLYACFGSKDELVSAYLQARQDKRQQRITDHLARHTDPRARVLAVFDAMADLFGQPGYRGCAFVRASAESRSGTAVKTACDDARGWMQRLFTTLATEARAADAALLSRQLMLLYEGAAVSAQLDGPGAAQAARAAAALLLDHATASAAR